MFRLPRRRNETGHAPASVSDVAGLLRASGLVDIDYYRDANPDVVATGMDPVDHYAATGAHEARNPNPFFDSAWYLDANPDVKAAGLNPLLHYISGGAEEGRSAGPDFDTAYYVAQNPEVGSSGMNPLLHYVLHGRAEGRIATPYDEGDAFELGLRARRQGTTGPASALFTGARADHVHFPLTGRDEAAAPDALPLPPLRLAHRSGALTLDDFDESGRGIRDAIVRVLPKGWSWDGKRCLDFGSGVGHALRHFAAEAEQAEFWGCDVDGSSIRWSVQNLSPPFRFVQIGDVPTLPFEDNSFDLVYAVSVLSHIHATWHQWLTEIRRVLKPGGTVFVTFLGPTPMADMLGEPYWGRGADFGMYVTAPHRSPNDGGPAVFVSPDWIKSFWSGIFDIDYIAIDGLMEYQSFAVMRKPAVGAPIRRPRPAHGGANRPPRCRRRTARRPRTGRADGPEAPSGTAHPTERAMTPIAIEPRLARSPVAPATPALPAPVEAEGPAAAAGGGTPSGAQAAYRLWIATVEAEARRDAVYTRLAELAGELRYSLLLPDASDAGRGHPPRL